MGGSDRESLASTLQQVISVRYTSQKIVKSRLRIFPAVTLSVFCLPIVLGLVGTWLPAFGYFPAIGAREFSLDAFSALFQHPAYNSSFRTTLISGLGATFIALVSSIWIIIGTYGSALWRIIVRLLSPLLAVPHAAFAIGFSFLIAPSGWLVRLVSPELTGFTAPPDWLTVKDPYGLSLALALALKEIPFLLLMGVGALNQFDIKRTSWIGRSLGYSRVRIWTRLVLPQLYPQLRLPVLAVLAYSLSVVDVAIILGPSVPPTLSVLVDRWFNDPDIGNRMLGAAGATWLFALVAFVIMLSLLVEQCITVFSAGRLVDGRRTSIFNGVRWLGSGVAFLLLVVSIMCLLILMFWSFTRIWRFPDAFPAMYTSRYWLKGIALAAEPLVTTLVVGTLASVIAIILVIGCLEYEVRLPQQGKKPHSQWSLWLIYLPLLVPQIAFLFGIQTAAVAAEIEGTWLSLTGVHLIFVLPYIFLTLSSVYRGYDGRYTQVAMSLSGSAMKSLFLIKLPMLMRPVAFALATGFAVSVAQYLPTLYLGAGRFSTITTETVSLASGSDRRVLAVYALCQFLLPMIIYCVAIFLPAWMFRHRKAMQN